MINVFPKSIPFKSKPPEDKRRDAPNIYYFYVGGIVILKEVLFLLKNIINFINSIKLRYVIISLIVVYTLSHLSHIMYVAIGFEYGPLLAPPIEELQKLLFLFINFNFGLTYTLMLSITEFIDYTLESYLIYDVIYSHYVIIRLLVIVMHVCCCLITYKGIKLYKESGEKLYVVLFLLIAITVHLGWNTHLGEQMYHFILSFY
jgi:hypothetical protein